MSTGNLRVIHDRRRPHGPVVHQGGCCRDPRQGACCECRGRERRSWWWQGCLFPAPPLCLFYFLVQLSISITLLDTRMAQQRPVWRPNGSTSERPKSAPAVPARKSAEAQELTFDAWVHRKDAFDRGLGVGYHIPTVCVPCLLDCLCQFVSSSHCFLDSFLKCRGTPAVAWEVRFDALGEGRRVRKGALEKLHL